MPGSQFSLPRFRMPIFLPGYSRRREMAEHLARPFGRRQRRVAELQVVGSLLRGRVVDVELAVLLRPCPHGGDLVEADAADDEEGMVLVTARGRRLDRSVGCVVVVLVCDPDLATMNAAVRVDVVEVDVQVVRAGVERRAVGERSVGTDDDLLVADPNPVLVRAEQRRPGRSDGSGRVRTAGPARPAARARGRARPARSPGRVRSRERLAGRRIDRHAPITSRDAVRASRSGTSRH